MTQGQWACVRKWGKVLPTIFRQYRSTMSFSGITLKHPFITRKMNRTVLINGQNSGRRLRVFYFLRHWLNSCWGEFGFIFHKLFEMWVGWSSKWNDHWVIKNWTFFIFVHAYNRKRKNVSRFFFCTKSTAHSTTNQIILKRHWFLIKSPELSNTTL